MKSTIKIYGCLFLTLFVWSSDFILGKYFNLYLPSIYTVCLRFGCAVCGLYVLLWNRHEWILPKRNMLGKLALLGICGIGIFNPMGYLALRYTSSINSVMLNALNPSVTAFLCYVLFKDKLSYKQIICIITGMLGIYMIASKGNNYQDFHFNSGDIMILINVCLWSLYSVFGKRIMNELTPLQVTFYTCLFGFLFMLPMGIWERMQVEITALPLGVYAGILYMGILGSCFGMLFWYEAVDHIGPLKTSMLYNLIPIFTTLLAVLFQLEHFQFYHLAGGILIIGSSMLILKLSNTQI